MPEPLVSIVIIDSRSDKHQDWVNSSIRSAQTQNIPVEVIVINNIGRDKTIGECWNLGVQEAKCNYLFFLGDDDYLSFDCIETLYRWALSDQVINSRVVNISSYMTAFEDSTGNKTALARQHTGLWKKDYLLQYPFNETLQKGIDREYIEETIKRGDLLLIIEYYFGYYYRRHEDYRCAGDIIFQDRPASHYFVTANRIFLNPITDRLAKKVGKENVFASPHITPELMDEAEFIWVEWANEKAVEVANYPTKAKKILRLHAYEAFSDTIKKLDLNKFDVVIFIDDYIKNYVEKQYGKVNGAIVIPNGVDLNKFTLKENKVKNNKIAFAGYLTRKKGIGELLLIAKSFPEHEFHFAGRFQEDDIADWFNNKKPDNVFIHAWQYDQAMSEFYQDKSFIINTSMRESQAMTLMEGMACGLKPIINDWLGADDIYPKEFIYKRISDISKSLTGDYKPEEYRKFVDEKYNFDKIYPQIEQLFERVEV